MMKVNGFFAGLVTEDVHKLCNSYLCIACDDVQGEDIS
jgi:hypothetical protein